MMTSFNILQIALSITGIFNCFIVAAFLFFARKGNIKANRILSLLLIAICLKLSFALLVNIPHKWGTYSILLYYFSEAGYFAFGPLLLLYFRIYLKKETYAWLISLMFLPCLIPFVGHPFNYDVPLWLMQASLLLFLVFVFVQLKGIYDKKNRHLETEKFWLKVLFGSFSFVWLCVNLLLIDFKLYFFELSVVFTTVFYLDTYLIVKHYWFQMGDKIETQKYKNSNLTEEEENEILSNLNSLMEHEKLYMDPEITLPKIAAKLGISPHKLSQVINQRINLTFNEYINSKRINDIKNAIILPEFQNSKISSIAMDYGFNTISAFNTAFKRFTNNTPSQYRSSKLISN